MSESTLLHQKEVIFKKEVVLRLMFSACLPGEVPAGMGVRSLGNLPRL